MPPGISEPSMSSKRDYYESLGVGRECASDELRKAYRREALKHHPDPVGPANDAWIMGAAAIPGAVVVAAWGAGLVAMHLKGELNVRSAEYEYEDALAEITDALRVLLDRARAAGVPSESLVADPGLEFGKEPPTDLEVLDRFGDLRSLGVPLLLASSRKSFLGRLFARPARDLLVPSLATAAQGILAGADIVRTHDVAETVDLARTLAATRPNVRAGIAVAGAPS